MPAFTPDAPPLRPAAPVPRLFLERVSRSLLVRLLTPYAPALERHDFPLAALASSAQTDRVHVEALWLLLSKAPADLAPLQAELLAVADVATPAGHELLLARDDGRALDHDLGAEDCAATAYLDHRALFDVARPQTAGQSQVRAFASFRPKTPAPLPRDPRFCAAFERAMSAELEARGRTSYFKRHDWQRGHELHMELVYGKLASARDIIGKTNGGAAHDVTAQVTDRTSERAHAVFHDDTCHLDVAGHDWMKELMRRVFGEAYFGAGAHFEGDETITLAPLATLEAALACDDVPGLRNVELQEVWLDLGGTAWIGMGARSDCMKAPSGGYALRALSDGKPVEATFHLHLANRTRPVKLRIAAPRRIEFDRRDPRVVQVVRAWVVARGFMTLPDHLRASALPAPAEGGATELAPS